MLDKDLLDYLNTYILKKDEQLELNNYNVNQFLDIPIIKSTKRTYRHLGLLTIGNTLPTEKSEKELALSQKLLNLSPKKKLLLSEDDPQTLKWLEEGWIIKEIRLKQDGKTLDSQNYRMGYRLFEYQLKIEEQQMKKLTNELLLLKDAFSNVSIISGDSYIKKRMLENIEEKFIPLCDITVIRDSNLFLRTWSLKKRLKYLHFILAFVQIGSVKQQFDWKEIGASYYRNIGGSKKFDQNQYEFLQLLESWSGYSAIEFGLTSLGHITPIYFSGMLDGNFSSYKYGPVHAITNIALESDFYNTKAKTLWIVENRGILTRLASQQDFLEEVETLALCCDGHVRSAHRKFINQILQTSNITQIIIWTDYDQDGMIIAYELFNIVSDQTQCIKWITPTGGTLTSWDSYEKVMNDFLEDNKMEQEEMTGDVTLWKKWIKS